jgi:hypothetical protein
MQVLAGGDTAPLDEPRPTERPPPRSLHPDRFQAASESEPTIPPHNLHDIIKVSTVRSSQPAVQVEQRVRGHGPWSTIGGRRCEGATQQALAFTHEIDPAISEP